MITLIIPNEMKFYSQTLNENFKVNIEDNWTKITDYNAYCYEMHKSLQIPRQIHQSINQYIRIRRIEPYWCINLLQPINCFIIENTTPIGMDGWNGSFPLLKKKHVNVKWSVNFKSNQRELHFMNIQFEVFISIKRVEK